MWSKVHVRVGVVLAALFSLASLSASAQNMQDSSLSFPLIGFQYSFDVPFGDLSKTFGSNSTIGASFWKKTKNNVLFGIEYNYIFGNDVKINPLDSISTSGYVVNSSGQFSDVIVYERGHFVMLKAGKIFRGVGPNPNCGLTLTGGAGFWLHQIYYYWNSEKPAQVSGNYIQGYDRLSYGPALSESFGYTNFSNNKRINFSISLEAAEGFIKEARAFEYDVRQADNTTHFDMTLGLKFAWYFPVYKSVKEKYYY